jgi:hypothetical protein
MGGLRAIPKTDLAVLKDLSKAPSVQLDSQDLIATLCRLEERGLARYERELPGNQSGYEITAAGRDFLASRRKSIRKDTWDWIRYGITTAISVAALILSIIALNSQQ